MEASINRRKRPYLWGCGVVSLVSLAGVFWLIHVMAMPIRYFVSDPRSTEERQVLLRGVLGNLKAWEDIAKEDSSSASDPDRKHPIERATLVAAIERFYIERERLPESLQDLVAAGLVSATFAEREYRIVRVKSNWEIHWGQQVLAIGN